MNIIKQICKVLKNAFIFLVLFWAFASSCSSPKDLYYMYNIKDSVFENKKLPIRVVEKGDQLSIFVSSVNTELANTFNMPVTLGGTNSSGTYWVDDEGQITMTKIGLISVAGLTYKSLKDTLESKLKYYLKDPIVNIKFENFRISILGEVKTPGSFVIPQSDINIFQALGLPGDINLNGKRKSVLLYRQTDTETKTYRLNLTTDSIMSHPAFHLKNRDVIYVEPDRVKMNTNSLLLQLWPTIFGAATLFLLVLNAISK
jgi:polysaccharide export outer membrane protein